MQLANRITTNLGIFNGKPIIRGMRFGVACSSEYVQNKVNHSIITVKSDATK